ncbi:serine/threonine protein kinase [Aphanomyces astaci]|uniref:Serine/threonine protein kinase n=1 Tax=Aphanomyces astaci TaxID=112090 RepID=W4FNG9_APHAT|nr:serine/threonine protein kinase [Aphanomyces astaci]ETV69005.1 serine/threonine protein kinase [Aphanomyces astaci]|eukprot:XP_009841464.1 serine/threonine protein kinase [Aphanomyces astaci]
MADLTCIDHGWHGIGAFFVDGSGKMGCRLGSRKQPWYWEDYCEWGFDDMEECEDDKADGNVRRGVFNPPYDAFQQSVLNRLKRPPAPTAPSSTPPPPSTPTTTSPPPTLPPQTLPPSDNPSNSPLTTTPSSPVTSPPTTTSPPTYSTSSPPPPPPTGDIIPTTTSPSSPHPASSTPSPTVQFATVLDVPSAKASSGWSCVNQSSSFVPVRLDSISGKIECLTYISTECHSLATADACQNWMLPYLACVSTLTGCVNVHIKSFTRQGPSSPDPTSSPFNSTSIYPDGSHISSTPLKSILVGLLCASVVVASVVGYILWQRQQQQRDSNDSVMMLSDIMYVTEKGRIPVLGTHKSHDMASSPAHTPLSSMISSQSITDSTQLNLGDLSLWRLDLDKLTAGRVLSVGITGVVTMGMYSSTPVAIKKLNKSAAHLAQSFIDEIQLMTKLDSPYILSIVGCCWVRPHEIELVTEYMEHGDLRNFLKSTPPTVFTWDLKRSCLYNMAHGLLYLHSMEIIHRDFKSRNVLLGQNLVAKLTDFGVSHQITLDDTITQGVGSFRWTAPEILQGKRYTEAADIYALGMVLWELDTHEAPYSRQQTQLQLTDCVLMTHIRTQLIWPEFTNQCPQDIQQLVLQCIQADPTNRPTALALASSLI